MCGRRHIGIAKGFPGAAYAKFAWWPPGTGYLGGRLFHDHPYQGILAGLALAFG